MEKTIKIEIAYNQATGLVSAHSEDIPGFCVIAESVDEVSRRVPLALKDLLEAKGAVNVAIDEIRDDGPNTWTAPPVYRQYKAREAA